jgi:hypothetical protein
VSETRIAPDELRALVRVMREEGVADLATTDLRVVMRPDTKAPEAEASLKPVERQRRNVKAEVDEDDELMYASVT